jgi:hypothetical protein
MILAFPQAKERERLPEEINDDTLRKYFTLTKLDLETGGPGDQVQPSDR